MIMSSTAQRQLLQLLVIGVSVLVALLAFSQLDPSELNWKMTVRCAHKGSDLPSSFADRDILPTNVKPLHYDIKIIPDMVAFKFDGEMKTQIQINDDSSEIKLNAKELVIKDATVNISGKTLTAKASLDEKQEILTLSLPESLKAGTEAHLNINYCGIINDKMAGFYRSQYKDKITGENKFMGATQFESTDARQAFPCWDEPAVKATFSITLEVPTGLTALSNMDAASVEKLSNGRTSFKFPKTPIMSTYLIAWVVGDLESIETVNRHGVTVRVWGTKGEIQQGKFALDVASRTLDFFTDYFDIKYPLPKMDMVAIPDFSAGAMENWGLVTYRTAYLLFDEENSSLKSKQNVAYVVGHELAHQWFGNLVTMEWWSDLWLNEGFATWVGWLAADHLFPEWDIWTEFVVDDCQAGLRLDGLRSSHPIEVPVKNPAEISQIFDSISYSKGASVIRMLVTYLGENTFRTGLRSYLKKHQYGNAKTKDLWDALSEASGKSVNEIMKHWTQSIGYPVLDVDAHHRNQNQLELNLAQSRFLNSGNVATSEDTTIWSIPLRLGTSKERLVKVPNDSDLLDKKKDSISLPADIDYFKFNVGQAGFYRVNYPSEWLDKLGKAIKEGKLDPADRIGLVSDSFAMTVAGKLSLTSALNLLKYFDGEADYLVWGEISSQLAQVLSVWWEQPTDDLDYLKQFVANLYSQQVEKLGFDFKDGESDKIKLLRPLVIGMAGRCGHSNVIEEARRRFQLFVEGDMSAIHPNLRGTIYSIVVREGGQDEYNQVLKLYESLTVVDQKLAALGALGSSRQPAIIKQALELTKKDEIVRPQDVIYITRATGANPTGRRITWEFVKQNWDFFFRRYGLGGGISLLGRVVSTSCQEFTDERDAQSVESFFKDKDTSTFDRTLQQSLERIRTNAQWLRSNAESVSKWLKSNLKRLI